MAFTSIGYDGTVNERQWAELVPSVGSSTYGIKDADDLKVTAVPGQPLMVAVASGTAWGHGVMDTENANTTITCDSISSGTRWDLITLRRDWQPLAGGPTAVARVTGTTEKVIPASRQNQPGVIDDQPLALVQWTAGQTQPTAIVDLRCWAGNGGMVANDTLALGYLARVGASVAIAGSEWRHELGANDIPQWVDTTTRGDVAWTNLDTVQGFVALTSSGWSGVKYRVKNGWVQVNGAVSRGSSWGDLVGAVVPAALKPQFKVAGVGCEVETTVGNVVIKAGSNTASFSATWPLA